MANPQHIQWLKEGVDTWNARRAATEFWPDFDGANLPAELQGPLYQPPVIHTGTSLEGINLDNAYIRDASLSGLGLQKASLQAAQLQNTQLWSSDLSDSTLYEADCSGAVFLGANLTNAKMRGTNFAGANLSGACLEGANLYQADLTNANLVRAKLAKTNLAHAHLIGADITGADPSKAHLFLENVHTLAEYSPSSVEISSIASLIDLCLELETHFKCDARKKLHSNDYSLYFRGERSTMLFLSPSVMRTAPCTPLFRQTEGQMLLALMAKRPEDFRGITSALSQWVLAQHHGLKTRLLDISRNPLVGLFHCCDRNPNTIAYESSDGLVHIFVVPKQMVKPFNSDAITVVANFAKLPKFEQDLLLGMEPDIQESNSRFAEGKSNRYQVIMERLYNYIFEEKPYFKERIDIRDFFRVFVVEAEESFERMRAQSGAFLLSAFHDQFDTDIVSERVENIPLFHHYKFVVPAARKADILHELSIVGVTREVLFPSLDEAAHAILGGRIG